MFFVFYLKTFINYTTKSTIWTKSKNRCRLQNRLGLWCLSKSDQMSQPRSLYFGLDILVPTSLAILGHTVTYHPTT